MPRRSTIDLATIAAWPSLHEAAFRAAKGRRGQPSVAAFLSDLDQNLSKIQRDVLHHRAPRGEWSVFAIRDPKPRQIAAPCFADRVLHHALMLHLGPILVRALIAGTFACIEGRGSLAAVRRAQHHQRRWPWVVKTDVRRYFASVDHATLQRDVLARRFKDAGVLALCARILARGPTPSAVGLPIGALTSQFFANSYLDAVDRFACEQLRVPGYVRYMDDLVWWCRSRAEARETFEQVRAFAADQRGLELKPPQIGRADAGVTFLGYRVLPGTLRLSLRRRRRYAAARQRWEARYAAGDIDALALQRGYASALAITAHADATAWRREQHRRVPPVDA